MIIRRNATMQELSVIIAQARAFGECRLDDDPTLVLSESDRQSVRSDVLNHLRRLESNRVARVEASRHRSARSSDGEVTLGSPQGSEETIQETPDSWAAVLARVRLARSQTRAGAMKCRACAPDEWPGEAGEHRCAAQDEDRTYGTIALSHPRHDGLLHDRYWSYSWPLCEACGEEYCTHCGVTAWYQCL